MPVLSCQLSIHAVEFSILEHQRMYILEGRKNSVCYGEKVYSLWQGKDGSMSIQTPVAGDESDDAW